MKPLWQTVRINNLAKIMNLSVMSSSVPFRKVKLTLMEGSNVKRAIMTDFHVYSFSRTFFPLALIEHET